MCLAVDVLMGIGLLWMLILKDLAVAVAPKGSSTEAVDYVAPRTSLVECYGSVYFLRYPLFRNRPAGSPIPGLYPEPSYRVG